MRFLFMVLLLLTAIAARAKAADLELISRDIETLLHDSGFLAEQRPFNIEWSKGRENRIKFICQKSVSFKISSASEETVSAAYFALRKLGFLFPHPRMKIIPKPAEIKRHCGETFVWRPILQNRGFHLHTEHPSEWVDGFFMDHNQIAMDTIWWLARNQQNLVQLQTIRIDDEKLKANLEPLVALCRKLGIRFGMSFGVAMLQQKNYYLLPLWRALTGIGDEDVLRQKIRKVIDIFDFDFVTTELGLTEFNSTDADRTLKFLQIYQEELAKRNKAFFVKSHVSSNQYSKKYGNFNFIPQFSGAGVGVQAHTVFFYGLNDAFTPMYGRKNFKDMVDYILGQKDKRPLWYFPETSYYIGMDIDIPLFLTDYLSARAADMKFLRENNISGQVNFSTGQELGYWLFDWNLTLLVDADLNQDPLAGLRLLGEDTEKWQKVLSWQTEFLKNQQLIQAVTATNLLDEFAPLSKKIHERFLFRELASNKEELNQEIEKIKEALKQQPDLTFIKNEEIRTLLEVLSLRLKHALYVRQALQNDSDVNLQNAAEVRSQALAKMNLITTKFSRYPESFVFKRQDNPTSYIYGYGWTASTLHYWEREESMIRFHQTWNPFFMNIVNPLRILF